MLGTDAARKNGENVSNYDYQVCAGLLGRFYLYFYIYLFLSIVALLGCVNTLSLSLSLSLSQVFWSPACRGQPRRRPPGAAQIGQPTILIRGPPQPLPPQDPNITGQQRQQQNLNLREFILQYMAGIHKCVDRYAYTERWTQTDRKIDRQIER